MPISASMQVPLPPAKTAKKAFQVFSFISLGRQKNWRPINEKNPFFTKYCQKLLFFTFYFCFKFSPFYLVPDSYSRPQTRESVESAKKWLEYESFEYESRLDTPLVSLSPLSTLVTLLFLRLVNAVTEDLNYGNGEEVLRVPGEGRPQRERRRHR